MDDEQTELRADVSEAVRMAAIEHEARERYAAQEPYQSALSAQYRVFHHYFAPPQLNWGSGDQWPADREARPEKIHVTQNVIRPFIMSAARLESILPRITIPSSTLPEEERRRAEGAEQLMVAWLDLSGWDTWLYDFCLAKGLYGKGVLKPYWNAEEKRGDVYVIELPWNLRLGYGASDYHILDWAIYEYSLSVLEVKRRFPKVSITPTGDRDRPLHVNRYVNHDDPLDQRRDDIIPYRQPSDYEKNQVRIWDYWYRDAEGDIHNAMLVEGVVVDGPHPHTELLKIPYIVVEHDHEPGSPEGTSGAIDLIDLQVELNRTMSHMFQYVADNVDPAWFLTGPDAGALVEGIIPKAGEVVSAGESDIREVPKGTGTVAFTEVIRVIWESLHRVSGLPEIALGGLASSDISGRAVAVQIQSHANRMDQRRARSYRGLKELMKAWVYMAEKKNPKLVVREGATAGVGDLLRGFYQWKVIAPEITPRDTQESVMTEINKLNARVQSFRTTMDAIGIENPEAELSMVREEGMDAQLSPERAQSYVAIFPMIQGIQAQQQQMQQQIDSLAPQAAGDPMAQAQGAAAQTQQQAYQAAPTPFEDQGGPQPMTQAGMPPPATGQGPAQTTLIRGGEALNQLAFSSGGQQ